MYTLILDFQWKFLSFFTFFFDHCLTLLRINYMRIKKYCITVVYVVLKTSYFSSFLGDKFIYQQAINRFLDFFFSLSFTI
jgi:hypothetical protein